VTEQNLAVLRTLAIRPVQNIAQSIVPIVVALRDAGYVIRGPEGWIATSEGCKLIEQRRTAADRR
jgi:hypothetical protein